MSATLAFYALSASTKSNREVIPMSEPTVTQLQREIDRLNNRVADLGAEIKNLETERDRWKQHASSGEENLRQDRVKFEKEAKIVRNFAIALRDVQNALINNDL